MFVECAFEKKTRTRLVCLLLNQIINLKWVLEYSGFKEKVW